MGKKTTNNVDDTISVVVTIIITAALLYWIYYYTVNYSPYTLRKRIVHTEEVIVSLEQELLTISDKVNEMDDSIFLLREENAELRAIQINLIEEEKSDD